jgi:hypothetical protein
MKNSLQTRRRFVRQTLATTMTITFTGLIRAHGGGGGGGETTTWDPEGTTWDTTWAPGGTTFETTPENTTTFDPEETTIETTVEETTVSPSWRMTCTSPSNNTTVIDQAESFLTIGNDVYTLKVEIVSSFSYATKKNIIGTIIEPIIFRHVLIRESNGLTVENEISHTKDEDAGFELVNPTLDGTIKRNGDKEMITKENQTGRLRHEVISITRNNSSIQFKIDFWLEGSIGSHNFSRGDNPTTLKVDKIMTWEPHLDGEIPPFGGS